MTATEIVSREEKPEGVNLAEVHGALVEAAESNTERLELLKKARLAATEQGQSPAIWLLRELPPRCAARIGRQGSSSDARPSAKRWRTACMRFAVNDWNPWLLKRWW